MESSSPREIRVLIYRELEGHIEIFLRKNLSTGGEYQDFAGTEQAADPSVYFSAARVLLTDLIGLVVGGKGKDSFFEKEELVKWLGVLTKSSHLCEFGNEVIFLVRYPNLVEEYRIHGKIKLNESEFAFTWIRVTEAFHPKAEKLTDLIACDKTIQLFLDIKLQKLVESLRKESEQTFAFLNCEDDPEWEFLYEALYQGYLQKSGEKWRTYRVYRNEFPSEQDLASIKGYLVGGSGRATYDSSIHWLQPLYELLNKIKALPSQPKIIGICFGHQAIAKALGGDTEAMKTFDRSTRPCFSNLETIQLKKEFLDKEYVKKSGVAFGENACLNCMECHGDHVSKLPPDATVFGFSANTQVEIFGIGDSVLCLQAHPEFNKSFMLNKLIPQYFKGEQHQAAAEQDMATYSKDLHTKEIFQILNSFLRC